MKKIILLFWIGIHIGCVAKSQSLIQFPDSNAIWYYLVCWNTNMNPPPLIINCNTYQYGYSSDSIFNGNVYKNMVKYYDSTFTSLAPAGLIRVDTSQKKVFFIRSGSNIEQMLYNFSANIGDTLSDLCGCIVDSTDSILTNSGYRKGFWTSFGYSIDGIGSTQELLFDIAAEPNYVITCFFEDNNLILSNPNYSTCVVVVNENEINKNVVRFEIVPNPVIDCSKLVGYAENTEYLISFFDYTGRKLYDKKIFNLEELSICKNDLSTGYYLIRIICGKSTLTKGFVIN